MKVGMALPVIYPWRHTENGVALAEAMHVDSIWAPDHLLGLFHPALWPSVQLSRVVPDSDAFFDPFAIGSVVGRMTEIPFGISVTDAIRRGPADVARSALTLLHLCKGGFNLGIGSGEAENLLPFGYSYERPVERTERFLETLVSLLETGRMQDGPGRLGLPRRSEAGRVKLWLAAHGPRMLRLAGTYADGWLPAFAMTPQDYGEKKAAIARHAAAAGRPEPESGLFVFFALGASREHMKEMFEAEPVSKLLALFQHAEIWRKFGLEHPWGPDSRGIVDVIPHRLDPVMLRNLAPRIPFELVEVGLLMGSVAELSERLRAYAERGCQHVVLSNLTGIVGGMPEVAARRREVFALRDALAAFAAQVT
ncbi:MAG TPA: LLM class flavin-dependent oxidoreductase [Candidatus Limnocylindria bacterium]|jgi:phthiodiolone/phenolphthiodiolone dimycocerosates ketoreductase|nr:LLM class flavin-dependent oxidoreductase [Candidatus Limnocylindria bacterium]